MSLERPIRHGTYYCYYTRGCRCLLCVEARRAMTARQTERRQAAREDLPEPQVETPHEVRVRRKVLLACDHSVIFGDSPPKRGEVIWCVRCQRFERVMRRARQLKECRTAPAEPVSLATRRKTA